MSKETKQNIKKVMGALALLGIAFYCVGCGGDLSIEEGPALKSILNEKESELRAKQNADRLASELSQCNFERDESQSIATKRSIRIDNKPAYELVAEKISAIEAMALAPKSTLEPLVIRTKCFFVAQNQTLSTQGRPAIYVIADFVKIEGRLETIPQNADSTTKGQIHIAALNLEVGPHAYFDTGDFSEAELQQQFRQQMVFGGAMVPVSRSELLENGVEDFEIAGETDRGTRVRRLPRADSPFSHFSLDPKQMRVVKISDASTIEPVGQRSDARYIFEAAQVIGVDSMAFRAEEVDKAWPGYFEGLVWNSDRIKFHAAARKGKFWSYIANVKNSKDWSQAFNEWSSKFNSIELPEHYETSLVESNQFKFPPVYIEETYRGESFRETSELKISAPGKIEIISTLGTPPSDIVKHFRDYTNVARALVTTKPKVSRLIEVDITVHRRNTDGQPIEESHEMHEFLSIPTPVVVSEVNVMSPEVSQDLTSYSQAFYRWKLAPGRRLNESEAEVVRAASLSRK